MEETQCKPYKSREHEADAHMEHVDTDQLPRLTHALHTLRTSQLDLNGEPLFHYLTDPPGKTLLQAYRENPPPHAHRAVFYAEIPPPEQRPTGAAWLLKVLLQALGDPDWNKREAASSKERRVKRLLKRETELVVIADIHHLTNSGEQFELLVSIFQTGSMMPLLIIGEPSQMRHVLAKNERFLWCFPPCTWNNTLGLVSRLQARLWRYRSIHAVTAPAGR